MTTIQADWTTLMGQAPGTVDVYLGRAVDMIDKTFGPGYATAHPDLVGQLVTAMSADFNSASFAKAVGEIADVIREKDFVG